MPFLTKEKTNWKYIFLILILSLAVAGGSLWSLWWQKFYSISPVALGVRYKSKPRHKEITNELGNSSSSEITLSATNSKVEKISDNHILLEFSARKGTTTDSLNINVAVKDKKSGKLIQSIEKDCALSNPFLKVKFFDLDRNGFMDFALLGCSVGANNSCDSLYLFSSVENRYNNWYICNATYDPESSQVQSYNRLGWNDTLYSTYKAVDGKLMEIGEYHGF